MSHPAPTRTAHEKFCTTEGWQIVGSAIGKNNTPEPLCSDAPSFLGVGRKAGLSTAMFVSWLPFDSVIESDAASQWFVIDSGYDLGDDRSIVEAAIATSTDGHHDLSFVYLTQPDLSGHLHD